MKLVTRVHIRCLMAALEEEIRRIRYEDRYVTPWERKNAA